MKIDNKKNLSLLLILVLLSILPRLLVIITPNLWSDEGVVATMSLRAMKGEFPIFFYGQRFMGSLEAYLTAVIFHCFGPSIFTLELLPVILSILFMFLIYSLAKRLLGYKVAFVSGLLVAIPSSDLMRWSYEARSHYPLTLVFGTLLFILTAKIVYSESSKDKKFLLLGLFGLVAGLGWWTNYLIIVYIIPAAFFLFLNRKKILFSKDFPFVSLMFLSGSLPLWIFNQVNHHSLSGVSNLGVISAIPIYIKGLFTGAFPILIGLRTPSFDPKGLGLAIPKTNIWWVFFLGSIYMASVIAFFINHRKGIISLVLKFHLKNTNGSELLILLFVVNIIINIITGYGAQLREDSRYLLPLFTCLPIFLAAFLVDLEKRSRIVAVFFLAMVLFFNVYGNIRHNRWIFFNQANIRSYQENKQKEGRLLAFLIKNGFNRIYVDGELDALGKKLILSSKESLIFSNLYEEKYLRYANLVDASNRVSYLFQGENKLFEENLKALGGFYQKIKTLDVYVLYTDFKSPQRSYHLIPRHLWTGKSTAPSPDIQMAFDGDVGSGWNMPLDTGTDLTLDFGRMETINKVSIIPGSYREVPTGYQIAISPDGSKWQIVMNVSHYWGPFFRSGPNPLIKIRHGRMEAVFPPVTGHFLRIISTGKMEGRNWSINEIFVYGPGQGETPASYSETDTNNLIRFLKTQKIDFAYADLWLSAVIRTQSNWSIGTITSNHFLGDNGEREPSPDQRSPVSFNAGTAFVLERDNAPFIMQLIRQGEIACDRQTLGPHEIFYNCGRKEESVLDPADWKVSSNINRTATEKAVDRIEQTRWSSEKPQHPGLFFEVNLGKIFSVKGFTLFLGDSRRDFPRRLKVLGSRDGTAWSEIKTDWTSEFYWAGNVLLKMRGDRINYFFNPVDLKFLKLIQEGTDPKYYWSIHELTIYGQSR